MYKHQRSAKYCLAKQDTKIGMTFYCDGCDRTFSRKDTLVRHQRTCLVVDEKSLKDQIGELVHVIKKLVDRPTPTMTNNNSRNNVVMNLQPITDEEIVDHLEHLTLDFILNGARGYADFAGSYPFKNRLICTDKARKKLRYKDGDGEMINDNGGVILAQRFFQAIAPHNEEIINTEYGILQKEVARISAGDKIAGDDLSDLLNRAIRLQDLLAKCQQAAQGENNELTKEFINHLSKMV
jgi:hypothetical protein